MSCQTGRSHQHRWMFALPREDRFTRDCTRLRIAERGRLNEAEVRAMEQIQNPGGGLLGDWGDEKQQRSVMGWTNRKIPRSLNKLKK
jgi:hypothetical protein